MIRIAIVDDEPGVLKYISQRIEQAIAKMNFNAKIDVFSNGNELFEKRKQEYYNIIFLDLEMPEQDGLQVAEQIRKNDSDVIIVIISNRDDLVFKTFKYEVSAFIRKKFFEDEIDDILSQVYIKSINKFTKYVLKTERGKTFFNSGDIVYVESSNHDVYIHDKMGHKIKVAYTLEKLENVMSSEIFARCHSGIIVNYNYIYSINKDNITLLDNTVIPLSRSRKKDVKNGFQRFMRDL